MKQKIFSLNTLLYLALILALLSSLGHVAYAFATTNGNNWYEAYISAIAIDLGLLALAAGISKRKRERRGALTLWFGVILFSVISTYANWLSGIVHVIPLKPDVGSWGLWLVSLRPILLSGVLPSLVIYLSEVVSGNYQIELTEAQKQAKKVSRDSVSSVSNSANDTTTNEPMSQDDTERLAHLDEANDTRQAQIEQRRQQVLNLLNQGMSQSAIANELQVSLVTVKRDVKSLNGKVEVSNEI